MDSSRVLVALQEREKWRRRRTRIEARLRSVQARRRYLEKELEAVRRKVAHLEETLAASQYVRSPSQLPFVTFENIR